MTTKMNLLESHPDISKQWHPTKNGDLQAENFTSGRGKKMWWICEKYNCKENCKHEYELIIKNKVRGDGCPYCSNKKICIHNSVKYTHPYLFNQVHPTLNYNLNIEYISHGSNINFWWICDKVFECGCKHEWQSTFSNRIRNRGCPYCVNKKICIHSSIKYTHNYLLNEWNYTKNTVDPEEISSGSGKIIWWLCKNINCSFNCKHEWQSTIPNRINGNGCPFCSIPLKQVCIHNSIKITHPEISKQWHPILNNDLIANNYSSQSGINVWWLCPETCKEGCKHEWNTAICSRINGGGCPYCSNRCKPCIHNSIVYSHPEIVKQWHSTKNDDLKPEQFTYGSNTKIWWICPNNINHIWLSNITNRTRLNRGCPYCVNKTEQKLYDILIIHYLELKTQFKVNWCKNKNYLPFDFVLENDKIIIELDGLQHFEQVSNWASPEETHINDKYKIKCANANNFSVIRLLQTDVFYDTYNWLEELKTNIEKIKTDKIIQNIYMCKDNEYDIFNNLETSLD